MKRSRKKIGVVIPKYGLVGGGENFAFELTERLAAATEHEFHVFARQWQAGSSRVVFHRVPIISFPKWLQPLSFAYFAQRQIKRAGIDLIHSHDRILEADLWTVHSVPHSFWIRDIRKKKWPSLFDRATCRLEKGLFRSERCRLFMPVSQLAEEKIRSVFGVPAEKCRVIAPGVDLARFSCLQPDDRVKVRNSVGLGQEDFIILFVGMNFELKGLSQLLEAVALLRSEPGFERMKILVAGKGDTEKFQGQADRLGLGRQVVFAGIRADMEKLYGAADMLALLSEFDTFGMVVSEAMAASLPVIISDRVGARDLVRQGENGFVVDRNAVTQTAEIIAGLSADQAKLRKMKSGAHTSVLACSWETVTEKLIRIYDEILEDG